MKLNNKQDNSIFFRPVSRTKKNVLALGAELKANYCVLKSGRAVVYRGFNDLKVPLCYNRFKRSVLSTLKKQKRPPDFIVHDLNPHFFSTRLARQLKDTLLPESRIIPVQHHYAHVAAAYAALGLKVKKIIGVACDGTGLGDDGCVWGCEFIAAENLRFYRCGHLNYFALPGGDKAVSEPWRVALALLFKAYGEKALSLNLPWISFKKYETKIALEMIIKKVNTPFSSSAGRLFDGIAALLGIVLSCKSEAQAAIALERRAGRAFGTENGKYAYTITGGKTGYELNTDEMIKEIVGELISGKAEEQIALKFHNTFSDMIVNMCKRLRRRLAINDVILCGGVFLNKIISSGTEQKLIENKFKVYRPPELFLADTGLSLGQAVIGYVFGNSRKNCKY